MQTVTYLERMTKMSSSNLVSANENEVAKKLLIVIITNVITSGSSQVLEGYDPKAPVLQDGLPEVVIKHPLRLPRRSLEGADPGRRQLLLIQPADGSTRLKVTPNYGNGIVFHSRTFATNRNKGNKEVFIFSLLMLNLHAFGFLWIFFFLLIYFHYKQRGRTVFKTVFT